MCYNMLQVGGGCKWKWGAITEESRIYYGHSCIRSFPFVPSRLVGAYYLHPSPPVARAIVSHNDLASNGTRSETGGRITYWGAQTEKILYSLYLVHSM